MMDLEMLVMDPKVQDIEGKQQMQAGARHPQPLAKGG